MSAVQEFAAAGGPVLGICNGFQILCEAGLLPGAMIRNRGLSFICRWIHIRAEDETAEALEVPVKHGEGQFVASQEELAAIEEQRQVAFRYCAPDGALDERFNPNGSTHAIAGLWNERRNVLGMMPHPEHAIDPDLGPTGGQQIFHWLLTAARDRVTV
jgi:phosphoribosylformylglycinamidine synthase